MGTLDGRPRACAKWGNPATAPGLRLPSTHDPGGPDARYGTPWTHRPHPHRPATGPSARRRDPFPAGGGRRHRRPRRLDRRRRWCPVRSGRPPGTSTSCSPRAPTASSTSCSTTRSRWRPRSTTSAATTRCWWRPWPGRGELLASPTAGPDDTKLLQSLTGIAKQVDHHRRRGADLLYRVYSVDVAGGD